MTRPIRIVTLGYQGFGNLGDEAILAGIEQLLAGTGIEVSAVVGGTRAPIVAFPAARRVASDRSWPTREAIAILRRADALVLAGGGLLHDHWAAVVPRYLAWTLLARLLGRPVVWLGVGVGPFRRRWLRRVAGLTLRLSRLVLVRDLASATVAMAGGGRVDGVIPDPALHLEPPPAAAREGLVVVVRAPIRAEPAVAQRLLDALAGVIVEAAAGGVEASIVTFAGPRDQPFADALAARVATRGQAAPAIEALGPDPLVGLARLGRAEAIVTVRLHGLLLAAIAGTPCAAVVYDDKIRDVAAELGLAEATVPLSELTAASLGAALGRARDRGFRAALAGRLDELRSTREATARRVLDALAP
jgi:polysaccharide pyruvyl transferase WcaK-like protein